MPINQTTTRPRTFHHEALAWRRNVILRSGTVSATTMRAVSNFCRAIDAAGIRSKFLRLNLICGNNVNAARVPLYRGASATGTQYGLTADVNTGPFTADDYSEATGLQGNAVNKFLDCTIKLGTFANFGADCNNVHLSVYNRSPSGVYGPSFGAVDFGALHLGNGVGINSSSETNYNSTAPEFMSGTVNGGDHDLSATSFSRGFHLAEYTALSAGFYGINGADVTGPLIGTTISAFELSDLTPLNFLGDFSSVSSQLLSAYSCGLPLATAANRLAFATAMTAFQTALRRNVT